MVYRAIDIIEKIVKRATFKTKMTVAMFWMGTFVYGISASCQLFASMSARWRRMALMPVPIFTANQLRALIAKRERRARTMV